MVAEQFEVAVGAFDGYVADAVPLVNMAVIAIGNKLVADGIKPGLLPGSLQVSARIQHGQEEAAADVVLNKGLSVAIIVEHATVQGVCAILAMQ